MSTLTKRDYQDNGLSLANFFPNLESWAVGFDRPMRLLDEMSNALMGRNTSFPPYDIKQVGNDRYQIEMAVAGFTKKDLKIELHNNQLTIEGSRQTGSENQDGSYLYKGIAARQFRQSFALEDHVKVIGSELRDGILNIELERDLPEEKKPRSIEIK
ncbi:MAG: Hsp20 family protein [Actinobacteria bacterium]|nr:Hsp20 family protein [Actinomycetota bacterium]